MPTWLPVTARKSTLPVQPGIEKLTAPLRPPQNAAVRVHELVNVGRYSIAVQNESPAPSRTLMKP